MATIFARANKPSSGPASLFWCCCGGDVIEEDIMPQEAPQMDEPNPDEPDAPEEEEEEEVVEEPEKPLNIIPDPEPWGQISVVLKYDFAKQRLRIRLMDLKPIHEDQEYKSKLILRVLVVPTAKHKYKTKPKHVGKDTKFRYQFDADKITNEELESQGLALSLFEDYSYPYSPIAESLFWLGPYANSLQGNEEISETSILYCTGLPYEQLNNLGIDTSHTISTAVSLRSLNTVDGNGSNTPMSSTSPSTPFGTIRSAVSSRSFRSNYVLHEITEPVNEVKSTEDEPSSSAQLLVGLSHRADVRQFICEVVRMRNFTTESGESTKNGANIETHVRISIMSSTGFLLAKNRTSVRKCATDPVYGESFVFQLDREQLAEVTVLLSVYQRKSSRQEMIGWCSFGSNNSSNEAKSQWVALQKSQGELICEWHKLLVPENSAESG